MRASPTQHQPRECRKANTEKVEGVHPGGWSWPELMELKHKTSTATWCIPSFISKELPRTLVRAAYADCRRDLQSRDRHALGRAPDDSNRASETRRADPSRSVSPGEPTLLLSRLQPAVHDC